MRRLCLVHSSLKRNSSPFYSHLRPGNRVNQFVQLVLDRLHLRLSRRIGWDCPGCRTAYLIIQSEFVKWGVHGRLELAKKFMRLVATA
jgi:hypothetical protein